MSAQHTRTPWEAAEFGDYGDYDGRCVVILGDGLSQRIAIVLGDEETATADAARIVQCVNAHDELVDALRMFIAWDENTHDNAPVAQHDAAMKAARAVIAKATASAA